MRLRIDAQQRTIESLSKRVAQQETLLRDMEIDVAAMLIELRVGGFPNLLRGRRATVAHVGHGAVLTPETKRELRLRQAATARAGKRKAGPKQDGRRFRAQAHGG